VIRKVPELQGMGRNHGNIHLGRVFSEAEISHVIFCVIFGVSALSLAFPDLFARLLSESRSHFCTPGFVEA
jgi:hypothetical protein